MKRELFSKTMIKTRKGYTLIELVVVVALLTGLSTILLLNSSDSKKITYLNTATRQLESAYMQAQAFGNSGRAFPPGVASPDFDRGYGVYVEKNSDTIIIYGGQGDADSDGTISADEEKYVSGNEYESIKLQGGVIVSRIDTSASNNRPEGHTLFRRGEAETHIHSDNHDFLDDMTIRLEIGGLTKDVVVNKNGLIYTP
jgi:prepilin-type N-terminal cleavage/methylation domain-containing protein